VFVGTTGYTKAANRNLLAVLHAGQTSASKRIEQMKIINRVVKLTAELINTVIKKKYYTIAALKDELALQLSTAANYKINSEINHIEIEYKYHHYAQKLLGLTSISKIEDISEFEIKLSDLSQILKEELEILDKETLNEVVVDAICRLYESVNFKQFRESRIISKIRWRFVK
jgi:hypothetical protein